LSRVGATLVLGGAIIALLLLFRQRAAPAEVQQV
jgi:hypothetical protein